jgi:hypothetical protein
VTDGSEPRVLRERLEEKNGQSQPRIILYMIHTSYMDNHGFRAVCDANLKLHERIYSAMYSTVHTKCM